MSSSDNSGTTLNLLLSPLNSPGKPGKRKRDAADPSPPTRPPPTRRRGDENRRSRSHRIRKPGSSKGKSKTHTPQRRIPGPAGLLALLPHPDPSTPNKPSDSSLSLSQLSSAAKKKDDIDFAAPGSAWKAMLNAFGLPSFPRAGDKPSPLFRESVAGVKASTASKVSSLIVFVSQFSATPAGDFAVEVKDPTGSVEGTLHRRLLDHFPTVGEGAVLVLIDVSVFQPQRHVRYLNITTENVCLVFGRGAPPHPPKLINATVERLLAISTPPAAPRFASMATHAPKSPANLSRKLWADARIGPVPPPVSSTAAPATRAPPAVSSAALAAQAALADISLDMLADDPLEPSPLDTSPAPTPADTQPPVPPLPPLEDDPALDAALAAIDLPTTAAAAAPEPRAPSGPSLSRKQDVDVLLDGLGDLDW
ncbi:uncharacterized protein AMSG_08439 [Thecamonas trahens ATCC 50062]|uniref:Homologous recombination OB-fold protein OB-fold domain-containing protein n=1 Tax=Thecamonas trahens ATCC 50062 TaxID=461836 RepID=A0A0L0DJX0_THETB|nr:hypothetical protein AMSG_08439 [Thecamonas trahens ATCC 50062]KNC52577.1 hypothetical protein AMSG_08439 [Thecamonas trahens ATCC 50062]|eukprot:XP_013755137.1 hypothetical protein AMSG_08439 [Thecamonas trahens ATCC 50062]